MDISQLNIRGRMAYGIACLLAYLNHNKISPHEFEDEMEILSQFTSAANLAEWDQNAKACIYVKYPDEVLREAIPNFFDKLYWIGASELYGQPSDLKESEHILQGLMAFLHENGVAVPPLPADAVQILNNPSTAEDYFGVPFNYYPV